MRLRKLAKDDDAVSPVIGVILMVAITVILAAVIASFVLGLGNQAGEVAPQTSFSSDYAPGENNLTIRHDSGQAIPIDNVYIRGSDLPSNLPSTPTWENIANDDNHEGSWSGNVEGESAVVSGDSLTITGVPDTFQVSVVWQSDSGEDSSTLYQESGPNAS